MKLSEALRSVPMRFARTGQNMQIVWTWDDDEPNRAYELDLKRKLRGEYVRGQSQHYLVAEEVAHDDDYCCCANNGKCFELGILHPLDCEREEPGDGLRHCLVGTSVEEYGWEDLLEDLEAGTWPISLVVESYGYWEREYEVYLVLEERDHVA